MIGITVTHWSEIGRDTLQFYNFTEKDLGDVKHHLFAGRYIGRDVLARDRSRTLDEALRRQCSGYGIPAHLPGSGVLHRHDRRYGHRFPLSTVHHRDGLWSWAELYPLRLRYYRLVGDTPPDTAVREAAYVKMLITGIAAIFYKLQPPLNKLDGYYMMCEALGLSDLKEDSTAYVSGWVKRHVWDLPVEVPYVPRRRRGRLRCLCFDFRALQLHRTFLFGALCRQCFSQFRSGLVVHSGTPHGDLYLPKPHSQTGEFYEPRLSRQARPRSFMGVFSPSDVLGCRRPGIRLPPHLARDDRRPLRPRTASSRSGTRSRARFDHAGGFASEGAQVSTQAPPLSDEQPRPLRSGRARSAADYAVAGMHATSALLHYADYGSATQERDRLAEQARTANAQAATLDVASPVSGTVLTPRTSDRLGRLLLVTEE